jgi:hypothetical protein
MKQKKIFLLFLLAFGLVLAGCLAYVPGPPPMDYGVYAPGPPPEPVVEVVPASPFPGAVWLGGYWGYGGRGWAWNRGYWDRPPRPGAVWAPGYWHHAGPRGWGWRGGHWR